MQLRFYKGDYTDILKVVEAYPSGGNPGDFVTIRDQVLFWHPERGNWIAEQHGIGSNAAILYTLLEMYKHLETIDDEIAKLWASLIQIPTPVITDDGNGTVTITDSLAGVDIYYTTDGTSPVSGTKYTEAFTVSTECTVKAIAVKTLSEKPVYSDLASKDVTVPAHKISESWGAITSAVLSYSNNQVAAAGGTTTPVPTLTVKQTKIEKWSDGDRTSVIDVSASVSDKTFASSNSAATVDANGNVTFANANTGSTAVQTTITASFSVNGVSGSATAVVSQKKAEAPMYYIGAASWDDITAGTPSTTGWYANNATASGSTDAPLKTIPVEECLGIKCPKAYSIAVTYNDGTGNGTGPSESELMTSDDTFNYYALNAPGTLKIISVTYTKNS